MASGSKSINNVPKYNAVVGEKSTKKNKKKKSIVSILSNKIQKKISKTILKSFEMTPVNHPKLLKASEEHPDNNDKKQKAPATKEDARTRRLREISERKKKEEEENNNNSKEPKLLPVPPRYSSNIPVRGSSSNYDVNYYNSDLFDHCSYSQSLPGNSSNDNDKQKGLSIKRSNSELTPSSSTENLSELNLNKFIDTKSNFNSAATLVQDSKITLSLADEIFKETSIHRSSSSSSSSGSSSPTSPVSSNSDSSSPSSSSSEKDKPLEGEDNLTNPEKFYFDEKRQRTIRKPIQSEKSMKINKLFRRDSEKYMDQQLVELCSTYYKDYYYGSVSDSGSSRGSDSEGVNETDDDKSDVIEINKERFNKKSNKSKSDDEKSGSDGGEESDHSYIIKSNSSLSYFIPTKNSNCTITKSNTLPIMDSKHISPKIITCPSDDPEKPTTHLVNISGVTIQTNDLSHLFWVPSYLHPEVHPLEIKKLMSTEANSKGKMFNRHVSIRRTKSFAESARVITPDNISENGEPVINQIQRHKTFDTFHSLKKNQRQNNFDHRKISLKKSFTIEEENENTLIEEENQTTPSIKEENHTPSVEEKNQNTLIKEELPIKDKTKEEVLNDNEIINIKDDKKENDTITHDDQVPTKTSNEKVELRIDTSLHTPPKTPVISPTNYSLINTSPTKPLNPSSLQNSSSIPGSSSEESLSQSNSLSEVQSESQSDPLSENESDTGNSDDELSSKIFLPDAVDEMENIPLQHGSFKAEENLPVKSGWSLWLSSFGKEEKKETESSKKHKRTSATSPKSPFSFFKTKSSTSLADKNIFYRQGKGITKAFILDYPLIFKPLTREAEDTIYSLSHTKLATTFRPMEQQVYINNIMQKYIRKYKDAAYKIPFKQIRPPKKRRTLTKQQQLNNNNTRTPPPKKQQRPVSTTPSNYTQDDGPFNARTDSKKKNRGKKLNGNQQKLVNFTESELDGLLERGIESQNVSSKKPKRRSKIRPLSDSFSEKDIKPVYKNLNHSISQEQIDKYNSSSSPNIDSTHYSNYSSSNEDDDEDDDEIPLAMLKKKRSSIITI